MVEGKKPSNFTTTTLISPKIIEKRTKMEREEERGNKRLGIVFCLFMRNILPGASSELYDF